MGVENYVATLKLTPVTDGARCFAEWSAEFDCAEARERELIETIGQGVFQGGFDALKRHFGRTIARVLQHVVRSTVIDAPIDRVWAVLRDFNSHDRWHDVVAESRIEGDERSDQVGCVRSFTLEGRQPHPRAAADALGHRATRAPTASSRRRCRCSATSPR